MDIAGLAVPVRLCRDAFAPGVGFLVDLGSKLVKESHIMIICSVLSFGCGNHQFFYDLTSIRSSSNGGCFFFIIHQMSSFCSSNWLYLDQNLPHRI